MDETPDQLRIETELLATLMSEQRENEGWKVSLSIEDVPDETGNYSLHDGLDGCGGGVSYHMRQGIQSLMAYARPLRRPIYLWKPDVDGSAALWLEGKIRCPHCSEVMDIESLGKHGEEKHDIPNEDDEELRLH